MNGKVSKVINAVIMAFVLLGITYLTFSDLYESVTTVTRIANDGVAASATLLEYKPYSRGKFGISHKYLIFYDGYETYLNLGSPDYQARSSILVIYSKSNPKTVLLGHSGMNVWELYNANYSIAAACLGLVLVIWFWIIGFLYLRNSYFD